MNKNVAALLRIDHAQLTDLCPIMPRDVKQSSVADLPAHLRIERRPIEDNVHFAWLFARQNPVDNRFRLEKIVSQKFGRLDFEFAFFNTDFLLLLCLARALTLFVHQSFESCNIHREPALARHQFREIERKTVGIVELKREIAGDLGRLSQTASRLGSASILLALAGMLPASITTSRPLPHPRIILL